MIIHKHKRSIKYGQNRCKKASYLLNILYILKSNTFIGFLLMFCINKYRCIELKQHSNYAQQNKISALLLLELKLFVQKKGLYKLYIKVTCNSNWQHWVVSKQRVFFKPLLSQWVLIRLKCSYSLHTSVARYTCVFERNKHCNC